MSRLIDLCCLNSKEEVFNQRQYFMDKTFPEYRNCAYLLSQLKETVHVSPFYFVLQYVFNYFFTTRKF